MYDNIYQPVISIPKPEKINSGGLCSILFFKKEDVLAWPAYNPSTGTITEAIQLKPGKLMYQLIASEKDRRFTEDLKRAAEGTYHDIALTCVVPGNSVSTILGFTTMAFHQWGLILKDRNGELRLIGSEDRCADIDFQYDSGTLNSSRLRQIKFTWQNVLPAPVYLGEAFTISVGGIIITAGTLVLMLRFRVGDPGAPMMDGDTLLINGGFAGKRLLVLADGTAISLDYDDDTIDFTGTIVRYIKKTIASDTLDWIGGVVDKETIEIYAFS